MKARSLVLLGDKKLGAQWSVYLKSKIATQERDGQKVGLYPLPVAGGKSWGKIIIHDDFVQVYVFSEGGRPPNYYFSGDIFDDVSIEYRSTCFDLESIFKEIEDDAKEKAEEEGTEYIPSKGADASLSIKYEPKEEEADTGDSDGLTAVSLVPGDEETPDHLTIAEIPKATTDLLFYEVAPSTETEVFLESEKAYPDPDIEVKPFFMDNSPRLIGRHPRFAWKLGSKVLLGGAGKRNCLPTFTHQLTSSNYPLTEFAHAGFEELAPTLIDANTLEIKHQGLPGSECVSAIYKKGHVIGITGHGELRYWVKDTPDIILTQQIGIPEKYNSLPWLSTQWFFNTSGSIAVGCLYTHEEVDSRKYNTKQTSSKMVQYPFAYMCKLYFEYEIKINEFTGEEEFIITVEFKIDENFNGLLAVDWYEGPVPKPIPEYDDEELTAYSAGAGEDLDPDKDGVISYAVNKFYQEKNKRKVVNPIHSESTPYPEIDYGDDYFNSDPDQWYLYNTTFTDGGYLYAPYINVDALTVEKYFNEGFKYMDVCAGLLNTNESCVYQKFERMFDRSYLEYAYAEENHEQFSWTNAVSLHTSLTEEIYYEYTYSEESFIYYDEVQYSHTNPFPELESVDAWTPIESSREKFTAGKQLISPRYTTLDLRTHSVALSLLIDLPFEIDLTKKITTSDDVAYNKSDVDSPYDQEDDPNFVESFLIRERYSYYTDGPDGDHLGFASVSPNGHEEVEGRTGYSEVIILPDHPDSVYTDPNQERLESVSVYENAYDDARVLDVMTVLDSGEESTQYYLQSYQKFNTNPIGVIPINNVATGVFGNKISYAYYNIVPHGSEPPVDASKPNFLYKDEFTVPEHNFYTCLDTYTYIWSNIVAQKGRHFEPFRPKNSTDWLNHNQDFSDNDINAIYKLPKIEPIEENVAEQDPVTRFTVMDKISMMPLGKAEEVDGGELSVLSSVSEKQGNFETTHDGECKTLDYINYIDTVSKLKPLINTVVEATYHNPDLAYLGGDFYGEPKQNMDKQYIWLGASAVLSHMKIRMEAGVFL